MSRGPLSAERLARQIHHLRAVEQVQQSLGLAAVMGGGLELEGKSASICISLTGSRRQLSIDNNERKRDSDEPDAPLLLEGELALGEVDVVIRGEESEQADNAAEHGFHQGFAVEPEAPPRRCRPQIPRRSQHRKQPNRSPITPILVHQYQDASSATP